MFIWFAYLILKNCSNIDLNLIIYIRQKYLVLTLCKTSSFMNLHLKSLSSNSLNVEMVNSIIKKWKEIT